MVSFMSKIVQGLEEAVAWAKGQDNGASVRTVQVPADVDVKGIRQNLGLTQNQFAARYGFSPASVRNWEQGQRKPEGPARLLLKIIEQQPEVVQRIMASF